jgi:hypothetical protein
MDGAPRRIDRTLAGFFFSPSLLLTVRSALLPSGHRRTHVFLFASSHPLSRTWLAFSLVP